MPQSFADQLKSIQMSPHLGQSLERAHRFARDQSHRMVTLEHLLLALGDDPEAAIILQSANVDLTRLSAEVSGYLGRLMEDMRAEGTIEPRPDPELLRVLQAAASAAQQSKRRQIDGAIVLAAIVGDGKSPAAGTLKALGMTFEEAIRALQRANTQARLKPSSATAATTASAPPSMPAEPASEPPAHAPPAAESKADSAQPSASPLPAVPLPPISGEDFLAAARTRIQQRVAAAAGAKADVAEPDLSAPTASPSTSAQQSAAPASASGSAATPDTAEAQTAPQPAAESLDSLAERLATAASRPGRPAPSRTLPPQQPRSQSAGRPPQEHPPSPPPPPLRQAQPSDGPPRPPLPPPRPAAAAQAPPGPPNRPLRAPRIDPPELGPALDTPAANGALATPLRAPTPATAPPRAAKPGRGPPGQRAAAGHDKSALSESIPRRMQIGRAAAAEVRIGRDKVDGLIVALNGRGTTHRPDAHAARALTVRLKAPHSGFWIEPGTPETQWLESASNVMHDDPALWRWTVVPQRRGRNILVLQVSIRTLGQDGIAAESAPPDRKIEIRVRGNQMQSIARWTGWLALLLIGAIIGRYAQVAIDAGWFAALKKAVGG